MPMQIPANSLWRDRSFVLFTAGAIRLNSRLNNYDCGTPHRGLPPHWFSIWDFTTRNLRGNTLLFLRFVCLRDRLSLKS